MILPWTPVGKTDKEIEEIKKFSCPKTNPFDVDPRSKEQIEAYRKKEDGRQKWLEAYRQWERYRVTAPDTTPKSFDTFLKHKIADDDKYKEWERLYREANKNDGEM